MARAAQAELELLGNAKKSAPASHGLRTARWMEEGRMMTSHQVGREKTNRRYVQNPIENGPFDRR